jgi:hypothetical protein
MRQKPELPYEVLTYEEVKKSADFIQSCQVGNGLILWHESGHGDPWNHVEAAMALTVSDRRASAEKAYDWLITSQDPEGFWYNYYFKDKVKDYRIDTNVCAYVAVGAYHFYEKYKDLGFLQSIFPCVEKAIEFVLKFQQDKGEIIWCLEPDGTLGKYALLTGSCSILLSLRCALNIANLLEFERPEWEMAAYRLSYAIAGAAKFEPKDEYAMDWYYPVLSGALNKQQSMIRIKKGWDIYTLGDLGVKCVSDRPWVTTAETAECVLALDALGEKQKARQLLETTYNLRNPDGSYFTGMVYPQQDTFPFQEVTSYSAAAVILANQALISDENFAGIWRGQNLLEVCSYKESISNFL